jgi:3-oxoacyl-[acyl-carrier protein] reductase
MITEPLDARFYERVMFSEKTIIVTGAASGIGRACTRRLLNAGNRVVAVDLDHDALEQNLGPETENLKLFAGDVARTATADGAAALAVKAFDGVDGLAHFAAAHSKLNWQEADENEFNRIMSINITGPFLMAKAAAQVMIDRGTKGAIVLTSSGGVLMGGTGENGRGGPAYTTSKGGVLVLVRTLAKSWGKYGIRVNAISPGVVETAMTAEYSDDAMAGAASRAALGRVAQPEEPAAAAIWLLSDDSGFITGENTNINGGAAFG